MIFFFFFSILHFLHSQIYSESFQYIRFDSCSLRYQYPFKGDRVLPQQEEAICIPGCSAREVTVCPGDPEIAERRLGLSFEMLICCFWPSKILPREGSGWEVGINLEFGALAQSVAVLARYKSLNI